MKVKACSALVSAENHAALPKHRSFRRERCWPCGGAAMKSQINSRNCLMRRHSSALLESGRAWAGLDEGSVTSAMRSEEHTSELQSLMRISYAVFCLKKKTNKRKNIKNKT